MARVGWVGELCVCVWVGGGGGGGAPVIHPQSAVHLHTAQQ